jgi:putative heme-binding domain-containing protein
MAEIIRRDADSRWVRAAILSSLAGGAGELFAKLRGDTEAAQSAGGRELLRQLLTQMGAQHRPAEVAQGVEYLAACPELENALASATALGDGLKRAGSNLSAADPTHKLQRLYQSAAEALAANQTAEPVRIQAIRFFGLASFSETGAKLLALLDGEQTQQLQMEAVHALGRFTEPELAKELIARWTRMTPGLRAQVMMVLLARPERIRALLQALADGTMLRANLTSTQAEFLLRHSDEGIRKQALELLGNSGASSREAVEKAYLPALQLAGDRTHGKAIYLDRCSPCHRVEGQGHAVGPDLASVRSNGKEKMLINILDPNLEVAPNYVNYLVETKDGESQLGLIANETATSVTLRQPGGNEIVLLRSNIQRIQSQGRSVMPEGLEANLKPQDFADLLEYLMSAGPAGAPQRH